MRTLSKKEEGELRDLSKKMEAAGQVIRTCANHAYQIIHETGDGDSESESVGDLIDMFRQWDDEDGLGDGLIIHARQVIAKQNIVEILTDHEMTVADLNDP